MAFPRRAAALVLLFAALLLGAAALLRGAEYDENYSVFVTAGIPRPDWPRTPFTRAGVPAPFTRHAGQAETLAVLRRTDVHPPLYFRLLALWRGLAGDGLIALRAPSVLAALAAVLAWMAVAWRAGLPVAATGLVLALSYGFVTLGVVVRGYALAQLLVALSVLAAVLGRGGTGRAAFGWAAAAGLAAGLACHTNYLAAFPLAAVLLWLVLPRPALALAAAAPLLLVLVPTAGVWLDQRALAVGQSALQFERSSLPATLARIAQYEAAALLGGLPLYVTGTLRLLAGGAVALLLAGAAALVLGRWRHLPPLRWLLAGGALAPPLGLLGLGAVFGTTPVELRYLVLGVPFAAALLAAGLRGWERRVVLAVQAMACLGLLLHPATRQPYRDALAALAPWLGEGTVLLVPFGEDGVGHPGALLREAPARQAVLVLRDGDAAAAPARAAGFTTAILLDFGPRDRAGAAQAAAAAAGFARDPAWCRAAVPWQEQRGATAAVFRPAGACR